MNVCTRERKNMESMYVLERYVPKSEGENDCACLPLDSRSFSLREEKRFTLWKE